MQGAVDQNMPNTAQLLLECVPPLVAVNITPGKGTSQPKSRRRHSCQCGTLFAADTHVENFVLLRFGVSWGAAEAASAVTVDICIYVCMYAHIHTYTYVPRSIHTYYLYIHICAHVCIYIYICLHTHIRTFIHSFISFIHSIPSFIPFHPSIHPSIHSFIQSYDTISYHSIIQSFIHSIIRSFNHSIIHSYHAILHSFVHSFTHSFTHSRIHKWPVSPPGAIGANAAANCRLGVHLSSSSSIHARASRNTNLFLRISHRSSSLRQSLAVIFQLADRRSFPPGLRGRSRCDVFSEWQLLAPSKDPPHS